MTEHVYHFILFNSLSIGEQEEAMEMRGAEGASAAIITPPPSPPPSGRPPSSQPPKVSPPSSSYDPNLNCVRAVEDEEAAAIALALDKSQRRPENVIPEQLVPTDDLTIVHIQPDVSDTIIVSLFPASRNATMEE